VMVPINVSVLEDASLLRSKELTLVEPHLKEANSVEFCGDIVMGSDAPLIRHTTLFVLSYLTRLLFHPLVTLPPPLMCIHSTST